MHPAVSNGEPSNGLNKMRLNVLISRQSGGRHWSVQDFVSLPLELTLHTTKWLFQPQSSHPLPRQEAERQKAEGQCHLNKSGPFYQERIVLPEPQERLEKQETGL